MSNPFHFLFSRALPFKQGKDWNLLVPTQYNILSGDQFAQLGLVWITLSIRSHWVYHHIHYCRGYPDHCVEFCLSGEAQRWNIGPGNEATVGQAAGLIWKDCCNYESPEELALWQVQCVNMVLTVRKVPWPLSLNKVRHRVKSIFSISQDQFSIWAQRKTCWLWPIWKHEKSNSAHDGFYVLRCFMFINSTALS